jgi:hypothetical protein
MQPENAGTEVPALRRSSPIADQLIANRDQMLNSAIANHQ